MFNLTLNLPYDYRNLKSYYFVSGKNPLKCAALAADAISMGDVIETKIRSSNNWELLDSQAFHSSVMPGHYMSGKFRAQIMFPSWLGKNSKGGKFRRFATELHSHMRLR